MLRNISQSFFQSDLRMIQKTITYLRERCAAVYVSFDIDCIDPAHAAGTGTPSLGGLKAEEMMPVMRGLSALPIVGFDLTEVNRRLLR